MKRFLYKWDTSINKEGFIDYSISNEDIKVSPIKTLVSKSIKFNDEISIDC